MFSSEPHVWVHPDTKPEPERGSGSVIWLNQTLNIMFGSRSNNVHKVRNQTMASLADVEL